jgi:sugar phosphate isomerase/epimerase
MIWSICDEPFPASSRRRFPDRLSAERRVVSPWSLISLRYSFMSFSLPEASLDQLLSAAREYGYDGIELRINARHGHGVEPENSGPERAAVRKAFSDAGVAVACVATSCRFADPATVDSECANARLAIELAADLGSHRLRVFGGALPDGVERDAAVRGVATALASIADFAAERDVRVCLETHDDWTSPEHVAEVMRAVDHPAIGVTWDVWHPSRINGLSLDDAYHALAQWIGHVHFHDGMLRPDMLDHRAMGTGQLDHRRVLRLLTDAGYDGFLSGEWIGWEPGEVHLPREIDAMRQYERELATA